MRVSSVFGILLGGKIDVLDADAFLSAPRCGDGELSNSRLSISSFKFMLAHVVKDSKLVKNSI